MVDYKEVARLLVKEHGIKEGFWGVWIRFGIGSANVGPDVRHLTPAAVVPVVELGIQRFETANNLTIDAAELWRRPRKSVAKPAVKGRPTAKLKRGSSRGQA